MNLFTYKILKLQCFNKMKATGHSNSYKCIGILGNTRGTFGFGIGSSKFCKIAINKSFYKAKQSLNTIFLTRTYSILYDCKGKFKKSILYLYKAPSGVGLYANNFFQNIFLKIGIRNIYCKQRGPSNVITAIYALLNALTPKKFNMWTSPLGISSKTFNLIY